MDEKERAEAQALREMFQTDGWRVLMRNTQNQLDQFKAGFPFNVNTVEQLYFSRGMCASLQVLLNMEQLLEAAEAEQAEAPEDDE